MLAELPDADMIAVGRSRAHRVLLPMNMCDTYVPGVTQSSAALHEDAIRYVKELMREK